MHVWTPFLSSETLPPGLRHDWKPARALLQASKKAGPEGSGQQGAGAVEVNTAPLSTARRPPAAQMLWSCCSLGTGALPALHAPLGQQRVSGPLSGPSGPAFGAPRAAAQRSALGCQRRVHRECGSYARACARDCWQIHACSQSIMAHARVGARHSVRCTSAPMDACMARLACG